MARLKNTVRRIRWLVVAWCVVGLLALPVAAQGTTLFSDNFDDGNANGWTVAQGGWSVVQDSGSFVYTMAATGTEGRTMTGSQSWSNYSVEARVKVTNFGGSNRVLLAGRLLDFNNYYAASLYNSSGGKLELRRKVSGSSTTLVEKNYALSTGTWYTVRLEMSGSTVRMYVNGNLELTATDSSRTTGAIGLIPMKAATMYDNVVVSTGSATPTNTPTRTSTGPTNTPTRTPTGPTPTRTRTPTPPPTGSWPTPTGQQAVPETISVSGTFDGGMRRYFGTGELGSGGQEEDQGPLFRLAAGATLRNVILGAPAADGIHCDGACTLQNVWWEDVGEDAATFRGSSSSINSLVDGGGARLASDKVFQHNGAGTLTIRNFQVENFGALYRSCGNCSTQFRRNVVIQNVTATAPGNRLAGINTNYGDTARFTNVTIIGNRNMTVCQKYIGNDDGDEPDENGSGADGVNCIYSASDIIFR